MKRILFSVALLAGCSTPDALELNYTHEFAGDSSLEDWGIYNDDSDYVGIGFTWDLKPRQVQVIPILDVQDPVEEPTPIEIDPVDVIETFTSFTDPIKIALLVTLIVTMVIFRKRLARLIPWGRNGNGTAQK